VAGERNTVELHHKASCLASSCGIPLAEAEDPATRLRAPTKHDPTDGEL
jgi:hypothetical protein